MGKHRAIALQVVFRDPTAIHPLAQTLVADELDNANGFLNGLILLLVAVEFVLVDQHDACSFLSDVLVSYIPWACMSREERPDAQRTNQCVYHPTTKKAVGKTKPGGTFAGGRDSSTGAGCLLGVG